MWPLAIISLIGYAVWRASQGTGGDVTQIISNLETEGAQYEQGAVNYYNTGVASVTSLAGGIVKASGKTVLSAAAPYLDLINANCGAWDPNVIIGIGYQESKWGTDRTLDAAGPSGTGDFILRTPGWAAKVQGAPVASVSTVPAGWTTRASSGLGPWVMPADGRGWGRGLCQIDYGNAYKIDWADPETNIKAAVSNLNAAQSYFSRADNAPNADPTSLTVACISAYNHGYAAALKALNNDVSPATAYSDAVLGYATNAASESAANNDLLPLPNV